VVLPPSFATVKPAGGIRLRIRAPSEHAGKLSTVTVGGEAWSAFNAAEETVDFSEGALTAALIKDGLHHIVATFAGTRVALRPARVDLRRRVVAKQIGRAAAGTKRKKVERSESPPKEQQGAQQEAPTLQCPGGIAQVDMFTAGGSGTSWLACEDLQHPGGTIVLVSSAGDTEWFQKSYEPYRTNASDSSYYLGLGKKAVAK
jgi:hypothetical protein